MLNTIFFFFHYALLLLFGISLSAALAGVQLRQKKNVIVLSSMCLLCGILQLAVLFTYGEAFVWKLYPIITHLPVLLLLWLHYRKRLITAFAAVSSAYLCCQPSKWAGVLVMVLTHNYLLEQIVRIVVFLVVGFLVHYYLAPFLAQIFQKDTRSVCIFSSIPIVYYVFDYTVGLLNYFRIPHSHISTEFPPFLLCVVFLLFCSVYYKEYEQKADAERKERLIQIALNQKTKEIDAVQRSAQELRLLRHDMRLFLGSLAVCIESGNSEKALEMISDYSTCIEGTKLTRFCRNDTLNFVLSDYAAKCAVSNTKFTCTVEVDHLKVDENLFAAILANALDNALNAQNALPEKKRHIKLMLKDTEGKLLLSVKNPFATAPDFVDGLPVTHRRGHGYGTQSIRYLAERLGGNSQFFIKNDLFVVRVIV